MWGHILRCSPQSGSFFHSSGMMCLWAQILEPSGLGPNPGSSIAFWLCDWDQLLLYKMGIVGTSLVVHWLRFCTSSVDIQCGISSGYSIPGQGTKIPYVTGYGQKRNFKGTSQVTLWLRIYLAVQGTWVPPLVGELRFLYAMEQVSPHATPRESLRHKEGPSTVQQRLPVPQLRPNAVKEINVFLNKKVKWEQW